MLTDKQKIKALQGKKDFSGYEYINIQSKWKYVYQGRLVQASDFQLFKRRLGQLKSDIKKGLR
jgi:hypothetical protein